MLFHESGVHMPGPIHWPSASPVTVLQGILQSQIVVFDTAFISTVSTTSILVIHDAVISTVNRFSMCFIISFNYLFCTAKTCEIFLSIFKTFFLQ